MSFSDFIPLSLYSPVYFYVILFLVFMAALNVFARGVFLKNEKATELSTLALLILITFYLGLRPISFYFGDMGIYNKEFLHFASGGKVELGKDMFWKYFVKYCSSLMEVKTFFLFCAVLYIVPLYLACKKWFGANKYIPFLMFLASFSFWAYGTNGIRNGIATSLFVYALATNFKVVKYTFFYLAVAVHGSMLIPFIAFVLTLFYKNPNYYLMGWLFAIPLSLLAGGFWENFFLSLGFGGERASYLTTKEFADAFSSTGFRWDFVLYSASAVFTGYYFIIKRKFEDKRYIQLFNIYLTANAFWILVIRASFSNRFAYLSWFLMAAIIFYPFFKEKEFKLPKQALAIILMVYVIFTVVMNMKIY